MKYQDLLLMPEWKNKRIEILSRDQSLCTNCNNFKIKQFTSCIGILDRRSTNHKRLIYKLENNFETSVAIDSFKLFGSILKNAVFYTQKSESYITTIACRRLKKGESTLETDIIEDKWIFVNNLHIHHNIYIEDNLPWEYDNNSLQTLCWDCHEELHKNIKIPVLSNNKIIRYLTPCIRCYGAGIFPEYNNIQNGICFRCKGAKYEELL